jgi:hypothetical protein
LFEHVAEQGLFGRRGYPRQQLRIGVENLEAYWSAVRVYIEGCRPGQLQGLGDVTIREAEAERVRLSVVG